MGREGPGKISVPHLRATGQCRDVVGRFRRVVGGRAGAVEQQEVHPALVEHSFDGNVGADGTDRAGVYDQKIYASCLGLAAITQRSGASMSGPISGLLMASDRSNCIPAR